MWGHKGTLVKQCKSWDFHSLEWTAVSSNTITVKTNCCKYNWKHKPSEGNHCYEQLFCRAFVNGWHANFLKENQDILNIILPVTNFYNRNNSFTHSEMQTDGLDPWITQLWLWYSLLEVSQCVINLNGTIITSLCWKNYILLFSF